MKQLILIAIFLGIAFAVVPKEKGFDCTEANLDAPRCNDGNYSIIVIGGGFGGVSFTYYADLIERLAVEAGVDLDGKGIDLSKVLLIEQSDILGGNARAKNTSSYNEEFREYAENFYGLHGQDWLVDVGGQRTPQLTAPIDRATAIDSNTTQEFLPFKTFEASRGRRMECPTPNWSDYSAEDPYAIKGSCHEQNSPFVGNTSAGTWTYGNLDYPNLNGGPAYNFFDIQDWAYTDGPETAAYNYMLYGSPNPYTCTVPNGAGLTCEECIEIVGNSTNCFDDVLPNYVSVQAALIGELGQELADFVIHGYGGFYGDFKNGTKDPISLIKSYLYRDWNTNAIYGYNVNSSVQYIYNLAKPLLTINPGGVKLGEKVVELNTIGGGKRVQVRTVDVHTGQRHNYLADKIVYASYPDEIWDGRITGNLANQLKAKREFNSLIPAPTLSVTVALNTTEPFWFSFLPYPSNDTNGSAWAQIRSFGEQGHLSRVEIRKSIAGNVSVEFRASYNDFMAVEIFDKFMGRENELKEELWTLIRNDLKWYFGWYFTEASNIPNVSAVVNIQIDLFDYAWYYINGTYPKVEGDYSYPLERFSAEEILEFAKNPLGNNLVCLAHNSWDVEYIGWKDGALRTAAACVGEFIYPAINYTGVDLIDCWIYQTFPECDNTTTNTTECSPYVDPAVQFTGTQGIIPSPYCTERWWYNDFVETPECVTQVHLTAEKLAECDAYFNPPEEVKSFSKIPEVKKLIEKIREPVHTRTSTWEEDYQTMKMKIKSLFSSKRKN